MSELFNVQLTAYYGCASCDEFYEDESQEEAVMEIKTQSFWA